MGACSQEKVASADCSVALFVHMNTPRHAHIMLLIDLLYIFKIGHRKMGKVEAYASIVHCTFLTFNNERFLEGAFVL